MMSLANIAITNVTPCVEETDNNISNNIDNNISSSMEDKLSDETDLPVTKGIYKLQRIISK